MFKNIKVVLMEDETEKVTNTGEISRFAQLVTSFRQQRGLSQAQLAQATQLSRTYVYHLETGQRTNPSPQVVQNLMRALDLPSAERRALYDAYADLTGQLLGQEESEGMLLDMGELASLFVQNMSYPAHTLDKLLYFHTWNKAFLILFDMQEELLRGNRFHLLSLLFDPIMSKRFHGWEHLARRLVSDFHYYTRTITDLPEYKALWKQLREYPEFRRIASSVDPRGRSAGSFVFQIHHRELGSLALRPATTIFTAVPNYSVVSYLPADEQTLAIYRRQRWQLGDGL
jgi:transcriptional regulator with XRE-family HTH domain